MVRHIEASQGAAGNDLPTLFETATGGTSD